MDVSNINLPNINNNIIYYINNSGNIYEIFVCNNDYLKIDITKSCKTCCRCSDYIAFSNINNDIIIIKGNFFCETPIFSKGVYICVDSTNN